MPKYRYKAFDVSGDLVTSTIVAPNHQEARVELERLELMVSSLRASLTLGKSGKKIGTKVFFQFNKELAVLVKSGVPLAEAVGLLSTQDVEQGLLPPILARIYQHLIEGESYSSACARYQDVFDPVYIASLQMGEHTGQLHIALDNYQLYLKRRMKIEAAVKQALAYPLFLVGMLVVVFAILFIIVIPKFSELYESFDAALPLVTQVVLSLARVAPILLLVFTVMVLGGVAFWRRWDKPVSASRRLDQFLLRIPIVGRLRASSQQSRCMRMIGGLLSAGTSLLSAVKVTQTAMERVQLGKSLHQISKAVEAGNSFSAAINQSNILNQQSLKMLQVGEATGALPDMLNEVAEYYESMLDEQLARFTALFEPVLMVFIGIFIGAVILAMYMPIFFLAEVVQ
ncbi:MAG TPA: hypothetical protein DCR37_04130 [Glaciecola sp.]|nr:hypothetical protein [Glaciecola sp.]